MVRLKRQFERKCRSRLFGYAKQSESVSKTSERERESLIKEAASRRLTTLTLNTKNLNLNAKSEINLIIETFVLIN
jgi:hypothetical protein